MSDRLTLLVFPHAGGSAAAYRDLIHRLQCAFDVHCVELPGHGRLRLQPFLTDMPAIADYALYRTREIARGQRVVFLGHSMGAWIAYLVAERLRDAPPRRLFLSAARPPHMGIHRKLLHPDHDVFMRDVQRLGGVPAALAADREVMELFLPALRADLAALEPFRPAPPRLPIDVPISVLRAADDDITFEDAQAWKATTTASCDVHTLPGGHFYLTEQPDLLCAVVRRALTVS